MISLSRRHWLLLGLSGSLVAVTAAAQYPYHPPPKPYFEIEDARGFALPSFSLRGTTYVLAEAGERYVVRVHNPTGERIEAVLSVDGRDAVSGRVADFRRQRGYIIAPRASVEIDGFRRSLGQVAAFRFSDPSDSYSARRGTPENVGIIGVAFYRERSYERRPPRPMVFRDADEERPRRRSAPEASPGPAKASKPRTDAREAPSPSGSVNNLGTEFAETRESRVHEVSFERRSSEPSWVVTQRYDDAEGLEARGIRVRPEPRPAPVSEPEAFPDSRFASPP